LNVVAFRFKEGQFLFGRRVIGGRSACRHCKRILAWYELIPLLSFVIQLGKCRACGSRISIQYPIVEFLAGSLVTLVAFYFFDFKRLTYVNYLLSGESFVLWIAVIIWSLIFLTLLLLSVIDYREYLIPDEILYFLAFLGIVWVSFLVASGMSDNFYGSFVGSYAAIFDIGFGIDSNTFFNHFLGALAGSLVIGAIFFLSRGKAIGFGDVILLGVLGFIFGWPDVALILVISFLIGAAAGLILIARREKGMKDFVPFAPFIALSSLVVFFYGADVLRWYFIVFNPFA